jgi:DNA-binding FadR family transcriptional regulator
MTNVSDTIVRRKLSHEVFDRLKAMITSGELAPGDAMPSERDLMDRFGVGRPAIREAMQALANIGLITITHGERARVQQLTARSIIQQVDQTANILLSASPDSLEHLKQVRRFFERGMVREAALRATAEDIAGLRATLEQQAKSTDDPSAFISADMRFHTQIAAISGNPIFEAVSEAMLSWLRQYHTEMLLWSGRENLTLSEHAEILGFIEQHLPEEAEAAMVKHLDRSSVLYAHSS